MSSIHRREFLAASAITLTAASYRRASAKPNETLQVAVMGTRIRGKFHLNTFPQLPNVRVSHIIEPDGNLFPIATKELAKHQKEAAETVADVRKVLEDQAVDVLVVAAPDHWHAHATIWALQAGKHVYCEKPVSHNLLEGQRMVQAAQQAKRFVQVGTQRRSADYIRTAKEFLQSGKLGKTPFARAWIAGNRPSIGKKKPAPVPAHVDYDLWLGPVPATPFHPNRFHYNWHWWWDLGTGELGNNGIHALDVLRYLLDLDAPTRISSNGGMYFYDDDQQTPDTQTATFDFPTATIAWEHRIWAKKDLESEPFGMAIHGENGTMIITNNGWRIRDGIDASDKPKTDMARDHVANFVSTIRGDANLNADISEGHKSTRLCHLGNIAFQLGQTLHFDANSETIKNNPKANAALGREYRQGWELPKV